jgi:competence protein ComEC
MRAKVLLFLVALVLCGYAAYVKASPPAATVDFFSVGQGDAILLQSGAVQMLVDGGPDESVLAELGRAMPFGDRDIEFMVLTHPHADHFTGLVGVLHRYHVHRVILSGAVNPTQAYGDFARAVADEHAEVRVAVAGDAFDVGVSHVDVLAPAADVSGVADLNDASIVLRASAAGERVLLMGDATAVVERQLLDAGDDLRADILKVGHHGSRYSTSPEFLDAVSSRHAVIEVGRNSYGHPSRVTLKKLASRGIRIWHTDEDGDVRAIFRAGGMRVCRASFLCR